MRKRIISVLSAALVFCSILSSAAFAAEDSAVLYVAPYGSDSYSGTIDKPLKTLDGARQRVRALKEQGIAISEVVFREGDYFARNVSFDTGDSGTEAEPITYKAYEGEAVRIKGSVELDTSLATQVTDEAVLSRVKDRVRNKLIEIDLAAQGVSQADICDTSYVNVTGPLTSAGDYNCVYVDGKEGMLAQWPNGRKYTAWTKTLDARTIYYDETEPNSWADAENWWIATFPNYDFNFARISVSKVDTASKTIQIIDKPILQLTNPFSKRWKAFNLLEELDLPGEFYIDRANMKLYMYPPYSLAEAKVDLSVVGESMLNISNLSNVTFSGIEFCRTRGNAVTMKDIVNVDFLDCTFRDISGTAIASTGTQKPLTGSSYWQIAYVTNDASYDMDIRGCVFENIGAAAIKTHGGNIDTLTPSRNVIEDNFITSACQRYVIDSAVFLSGCGNTFRNNNMTKCTQHAITISGNDHMIEKNEIHDVLREVADAGAIYQGRNQLYRGTTIQKNFIHDIMPADPKLTAGTVGIYMDDGQQGLTIEQNIIVGAKSGYNSNQGSAMKFNNNTVVGGVNPWVFHNGNATAGDKNEYSMMGTTTDMVNNIADRELFFKAYPDLKDWYETKSNPLTYSEFGGNLAVGTEGERVGSQMEKYAKLGKNLLIDETDAFVDAANMDYRIKSDSDMAKEMPGLLDDTFDIEEIGLKNNIELNEETAPFRLLYPHNGSVVSKNDLQLYWQDALGANEYHVVVAKDTAFTDVIYDEISRYNIMDLSNLENNTKYYWKVTACNTSREMSSEWKHSGAVYSFTTAMYEIIQTEGLDIAIESAERSLATVIEGTEAGTYKTGTADRLKQYIATTKNLAGLRLGKYTQEALDVRTSVILNYFSDKSMINGGFVDLAKYMDSSLWAANAVIENGTLSNINSEEDTSGKIVGSTGLSHLSGSVIYCFDAELVIAPEQFMGIGLNLYNSAHQYVGTNRGYFMCIKKDLIELQKTDGSKNAVVDVKDVAICDGNKHSICWGIINTAAGCHVIAMIDGEMVFDYSDTTETAPTEVPMQFVTSLTRLAGSSIVLSKSENIPSAEEFEAILKKAEYKAAQSVLATYVDVTGIKVIKANGGKILTEDGVIDVSYAMPEYKDKNMMIPADAAAKMFGGKADVSANSANITVREVSMSFCEGAAQYTADGTSRQSRQAAYMKNGHLMISVQDVLSAIGIELSDDFFNGMVTVTDSGSVNTVNDSKQLSRTSKIIDKLTSYHDTEDVYYNDLK